MSRPKGKRNPAFETKRQRLLDSIRANLVGENPPSSYRALAECAGVTIPTLKHYFGGRAGVFEAVFGDCHSGGKPELLIASTPRGSFAKSTQHLLEHAAAGFEYGGLTALNRVGLQEGMQEATVAKSYLDHILEPTLQAFQTRLEAHVASQEMKSVDTRVAAISLLAPLLILYLHQDALGGQKSYPLDKAKFIRQLAELFVAQYRI